MSYLIISFNYLTYLFNIIYYTLYQTSSQVAVVVIAHFAESRQQGNTNKTVASIVDYLESMQM